MDCIFHIIDWIFFLLLAVNVIYIFVFSMATLRGLPPKPVPTDKRKRYLMLIAAYREDAVIQDTVKSCLNQDYPKDMYDVLVISDHMTKETNDILRAMPIKLLQVDFEKSTNTKSLKAALEHVGKDAPYDVAMIIDADNIINEHYLSEVNDAFANPDVKILQTHRVAKNLNTNTAYLDAISEEMNNSIFRLGHVNLGMPTALIGSGMAFEFNLFYDAMMTNTSVGGFDRVLEMKLLYQGYFFHYLPHTKVLDEKIQKMDGFYNQRRRWLSAQYYSFAEFANQLPTAIKEKKWGFVDKIYQQAAFSRVLLLGFIAIFAILSTIFYIEISLKWWILLGLLLLSLGVAIPRKYWGWRLLKSVLLVPYSFVLMFLNLFRLKEANKRFIHTQHGTGTNANQ
ncbi:MAG: glycosyltransferase family 2 protein [Bacteroides sp.]|nr:glycosyltransferase family 2 protein [Bacteroides sp.]